MNKLILWEYLKDNPGWHTSAELREKFEIKQQATLKNWLEVPFIVGYNSNRSKSYKFLESKMAEYDAALEAEVYVPEPKEVVIKGKKITVPKELVDERFTIRFPFRDSELADIAKIQLRAIAALGPEFDWVKEATLSVGENKLSEKHKKVAEALTVVMAMMLRYNTVDFSEYLDAIRNSLKGETLEDIRQAELADIMKHAPKKDKPVVRPEINPNVFPEEWLEA